jgi:hypothetical protein
MELELVKAEDVIKKNKIHNETVKEFVEKLKHKYHNVSDDKNNLPLTEGYKSTRKGSIYRPDILVKDINNNITHIIEIESGDGGKSMIGALFLADACISLNIKTKCQDSNVMPELIFVILGTKYNAIKRENALEPYLKSISHLKYHFCTKKEAKEILFGN